MATCPQDYISDCGRLSVFCHVSMGVDIPTASLQSVSVIDTPVY